MRVTVKLTYWYQWQIVKRWWWRNSGDEKINGGKRFEFECEDKQSYD